MILGSCCLYARQVIDQNIEQRLLNLIVDLSRREVLEALYYGRIQGQDDGA